MLYILELIGTMAFAISGVMASLGRRPDWIGAMIMAFVTAIGGGVIRDAILGQPSVAFRDPNIFYVTVVSAVIAISMSDKIERIGRTLAVADAVGLGLFNSAGLVMVLSSADQPVPYPFALVLGAVTGCGGGIVRDVLCARMPALLRPREIYISACLVGGAAGLTCFIGGSSNATVGIVTAVVTLLIRLLAIRFNWKLPAVKHVK